MWRCILTVAQLGIKPGRVRTQSERVSWMDSLVDLVSVLRSGCDRYEVAEEDATIRVVTVSNLRWQLNIGNDVGQ